MAWVDVTGWSGLAVLTGNLMSKSDDVAFALQAVRQRKLKEMEAEGVPAKYRAELARKKMTNW